MRILIVQNNRRAPAGFIGEAVVRNGGVPVTIRADEGEPLPDTSGFAGLIVLGGPQDAWDDARFPYFPRVLDLIRAFAAARRPVLGICLGAQLIARAFGARVYRHHTPEIGFHPVSLTPEAETDPLLAGMGGTLTMTQWHYDSFDLPEGAVHLARSEACANQAFRLGDSVHGFQFHPEATAAIIADWAASFGEEGRERNRSVLAGLDAQMAEHLPAQESVAATLGARWMELVRGA